MKQFDFREAHSDTMMGQYMNTLNVKALYWQ